MSTYPRQRVPDQHVYHAGTTKLRMHQDHPRWLFAHLADDLDLLPTLGAPQRLQGCAIVLFDTTMEDR